MPVFLCGLPKSGKTVLGRKAALQLNYAFIDTDQLIEEAFFKENGRLCSCREIYQEIGEQGFRHMERERIGSIDNEARAVISLGGGALELGEIAEMGLLLYLKAPLEVVWGRIKARGLPAYLGSENPFTDFTALAHQRIPIYEKHAHASIDLAALSRQQAISSIIQLIEQQYGK